MQLKPSDSRYPKALEELPNPPPVLTTSGPIEARRAVAIVGSRKGCPEALAFAHDLAFGLASAGIVVVSGGAHGIDGAAHRGALAAGGPTWVVSPTGKNRIYPPTHRALFEEVASSATSRMLWPFADHEDAIPRNFRYRNGVLVALSEAVVVVQAQFKSGSRNASAWARSLKRPLWAVPAAPWMLAFSGSSSDIERGFARPLWSSGLLFEALGLAPQQLTLGGENNGWARPAKRIPSTPLEAVDTGGWSTEERLVFASLLPAPLHTDQIVESTGLPVPPVSTALLTLTLKDVVVEGPNGFFRRRSVA